MTSAEVARSFYDAVEGGDLDGGLALIADDCPWKEMDGFPYRGTYVGPEAVRDGVFFRLGTEWDGFRFVVDDVFGEGDRAVGVGTYSGTFKATGVSMEARAVHVFRVRDDKIVGFEQFTDTLPIATATGER